MWVSFSVRWDENFLQKELGYETDLRWCGEISHSAVWNTSVNWDFASLAVQGMENFLVSPRGWHSRRIKMFEMIVFMQTPRMGPFLWLTCNFCPTFPHSFHSSTSPPLSPLPNSLACGDLFLSLCLQFCFCISLSSPSRFFLPAGMFPGWAVRLLTTHNTGALGRAKYKEYQDQAWTSEGEERAVPKPPSPPPLKEGLQWWAGRVAKGGVFSVSSEKKQCF